jgi:Ran GTPase-activating protein (RanGAP) involved in mRNA processing and transport
VTAKKVAELLNAGNTKVKEIGLKWNRITAIGGNLIANSLCQNNQLKVLDLSWNLIGQLPKDQPTPSGKIIKLMEEGDVGKAWGSMFIENKTLVHLDLSQNRIGQYETEQMSEDIIGN